jgi:hypothetical protein
MLEILDIKLIIALIASALTVIGYIPYLRDVFKKKTQPHLYTWLIWAITQGTATVALIYGGGKFGSLALIVGTLLVVFICALSFKYGTKNITRGDTVTLIIALLAIFVWWQLDNPLLAVLMVSAIDGFGYLPTFRKSYEEPWSETISFWLIMTVVTILTLIANDQYNLLTTTYLTVLAVANISLYVMIFYRRKNVPKPAHFSSPDSNVV